MCWPVYSFWNYLIIRRLVCAPGIRVRGLRWHAHPMAAWLSYHCCTLEKIDVLNIQKLFLKCYQTRLLTTMQQLCFKINNLKGKLEWNCFLCLNNYLCLVPTKVKEVVPKHKRKPSKSWKSKLEQVVIGKMFHNN